MKYGFLLFLIFMIGCQSGLSDVNENVSKVNAMFDAFNKHDWKAMTTFYSDSAMFLDPSFGDQYVLKNRTEIAAKYAEMQEMFPDLHDEIVGLYPSGDKIIVEFVSTGHMSDSISFRLPIVSVLTFQDGLIVRDATYYDNF